MKAIKIIRSKYKQWECWDISTKRLIGLFQYDNIFTYYSLLPSSYSYQTLKEITEFVKQLNETVTLL